MSFKLFERKNVFLQKTLKLYNLFFHRGENTLQLRSLILLNLIKFNIIVNACL